MTLKLGKLYFRCWCPPWHGWEFMLSYTPKYAGPIHKTSISLIETKD